MKGKVLLAVLPLLPDEAFLNKDWPPTPPEPMPPKHLAIIR